MKKTVIKEANDLPLVMAPADVAKVLRVSKNKVYEIVHKKAGIVGATMHTLRHTYATRCFEAGVDIKAVSEQLGHKTVKTTYNVYVHLLDDTKAKEIDKLDGIDKFIA